MNDDVLEAKNFINYKCANFWNAVVLGFCIITLVAFYLIPSDISLRVFWGNFTPIHTILEFFSIVPAFAVATLGLATSRTVRAKYIVILSFACLIVGILDVGHVLSYKGMADFITPSSLDKSIYFSLASRVALTLTLLYISVFSIKTRGEDDSEAVKLCCGSAITLLYVGVISYVIFFYFESLPTLFVEGSGLTNYKKGIEFSFVFLTLVASILFYIQQNKEETKAHTGTKWLAFGCFIFSLCGLCFSSYTYTDDRFTLLGHVFKIIAMGYVYYAIYLECVVNPLDKMKELAIKAETAERTKTQFLANVSHELRTPLGIISGYSEMLEARSDKTEAGVWAKIIRKNSDQLKLLIDDLLDLVKVDSDDFKLTYSQFSLSEFLSQCEDDFKNEFHKKGVSFTIVNHTQKNLYVITDKHRLRQIFNNMLSNAKKFTERGFVRIEVFKENNLVIVKVADSGSGIHEQYIEHLFKPFNQLHDLTKSTSGGTGLGLSISQKLSQLLGGDLYLEETQVNQGTIFVFSFEDKDENNIDKINSFHSNKPKPIPTFESKRVLITDDVSENLNLLELYLLPTQVEVVRASSGDEALKELSRKSIDLILLDIQMPIKDGYETAKEIRSKGLDLPIIAISAHAHESEKQKAFESGFQDYLLKPIEATKLHDCLSKYL